MQILQHVLSHYGIKDDALQTETIGSGLIHHTWKLTANGKQFILQQINHQVFKIPEDIAFNLHLIDDYLKQHHPAYLFTSALPATDGSTLVHIKGEGYYRMFPFIYGSHTIDVVETKEQAYEAARQFGKFTKLLSGISIHQIKITLPSFHDLSLRYQQFQDALLNGNKQRINESKELIQKALAYSSIENEYQKIIHNPAFKLRVTHHDTKISNVLFNNNDEGLCVIDLDTVMPGYFISDVGDMMRTYLSPVSEEETDFNKIIIREAFYHSIVNGYLSEMKDELSETEKKSFFFAGQFMMYMQAIRFLTDYINDDVYYGAKYPLHNYNRAKNQLILLDQLLQKEKLLNKVTNALK